MFYSTTKASKLRDLMVHLIAAEKKNIIYSYVALNTEQ